MLRTEDVTPPDLLIVDSRPDLSMTLHWPGLIMVTSAVFLANLIVKNRRSIISSWVISTWAPEHIVLVASCIGMGVGLAGCALAIWKRRQLFVYGLFEIVFGCYSAFQAAMLLWPAGESAKLLTIASALYVVSRGVGNVMDAYEKQKAPCSFEVAMRDGAAPLTWRWPVKRDPQSQGNDI